ncbi:MAG: hypothetical protein WDM79_01995 [Terricaulis sp.]
MTVDLTISDDTQHTLISVPHIAAYESELRRAVSKLEQSDPTPHSMFDGAMQSWRQTEERWPTHNDEELGRSFSDRIVGAMSGAAVLASDTEAASHLGPPPPASAGPTESVVEDVPLDAHCREIITPPPLSPSFVADLLRNGFSRDEIPEIDVALSNVTLTSSPEWGHIWRADAHNNRSPPESGWARSVCWRKNADEQPGVTAYPMSTEDH